LKYLLESRFPAAMAVYGIIVTGRRQCAARVAAVEMLLEK
jgi:hypothetical protein